MCEFSGLCELGFSHNPGNLHARGHSVRTTPETRKNWGASFRATPETRNIGAKCGASGARRPRAGRSPGACAAVSLPCTGRRAVGCGGAWGTEGAEMLRTGKEALAGNAVLGRCGNWRIRFLGGQASCSSKLARTGKKKLQFCGVRREACAVFGEVGSGLFAPCSHFSRKRNPWRPVRRRAGWAFVCRRLLDARARAGVLAVRGSHAAGAGRMPAGCVRGCSATGRLLGCAVCRAVGCGGA